MAPLLLLVFWQTACNFIGERLHIRLARLEPAGLRRTCNFFFKMSLSFPRDIQEQPFRRRLLYKICFEAGVIILSSEIIRKQFSRSIQSHTKKTQQRNDFTKSEQASRQQ